MKKLFANHFAILFILCLWFVFASPYFLQGKVPYASNYQVNFFKPWSHHQEFWGPVKNNAMPDVHSQIYPWKKFTINTLKSGQISYWNPYSFAGNPHVANFQSAVLSPLNSLFFLLPFVDAWSLLILLQPLLAGFFIYLLIRSFALSKESALISSISFMFCGFIVVWMAYGTLAYAILYLPLALYAINSYMSQKKVRFLILLSFTIPLSFFSGHFQISLYFLLFVLAYIFYELITTRSLRNVFLLLLATFFGLLLSLPQLLPSIEFYGHSIRSGLFLLSEVIPPVYLVTIFSPDFFGNPVTRNDWFGHYAEWAGYIGIIPLLLSLYAVQKRNKTIIFFASAGILSLLLAMQTPLSEFIVSLRLPVISTSALSRIIVLFSFSFCVLAAFGFENLKTFITKKQFRQLVPPLAIVGAVILTIWILLFANALAPDKLVVAKRNLVLPTVLFGGAIIAILMNVVYKRFLLFTIFYLLFALSFDSLRFAQKWMPFDPKNLVYPEIPVTKAIQKNIGNGRIFGHVGGEYTTYYGFPSLEGYDPLYISRYGQFIRSSADGEFMEAERSVVSVPKRGKYADRALDLLGVSLVFHTIADTHQVWAFPVWEREEKYQPFYKDAYFELYKNTQMLPRAALFYKYELLKNDKEIIKTFYSDSFDFRNILILEEDPKLRTNDQTKGHADIISYTANKIQIKATSQTEAILFLSDNYYPGWKATVNGKEEKIYRADYSFRAVKVPSGESVIEFTYFDTIRM